MVAITDQAGVKRRLCEHLAKGASLRKAAELEGVGASTVLLWSGSDPAFAEQYAHAREIGYQLLADDLIAVSDDQTLDPNSRRIMVDTRKWMLSKMLPRVFADRVDVAVTHTDMRALSTQDLERIASQALTLLPDGTVEGGASDIGEAGE